MNVRVIEEEGAAGFVNPPSCANGSPHSTRLAPRLHSVWNAAAAAVPQLIIESLKGKGFRILTLNVMAVT